MTLHVFVATTDLYKAWGYALGFVTAKPGETWPARACGYIEATITRHLEDAENDLCDPGLVGFFLYSDEYRDAIFAILDAAGVERTVLQAAA